MDELHTLVAQACARPVTHQISFLVSGFVCAEDSLEFAWCQEHFTHKVCTLIVFFCIDLFDWDRSWKRETMWRLCHLDVKGNQNQQYLCNRNLFDSTPFRSLTICCNLCMLLHAFQSPACINACVDLWKQPQWHAHRCVHQPRMCACIAMCTACHAARAQFSLLHVLGDECNASVCNASQVRGGMHISRCHEIHTCNIGRCCVCTMHSCVHSMNALIGYLRLRRLPPRGDQRSVISDRRSAIDGHAVT